jgi:DNA-binding transcriptional LysR family regulator
MNDPLARGGLSIDRLRSFLAVADAGGMTAAAPGNPTRQSQLSRQISEIEDAYGLKIIERRGRGIVLTDAGKALAIAVRDMLAALRDVATHNDPGLVDIALGAGDSVIQWWVSPRADAFGAARLRVSMLSGPEVIDGLVDSQLDFGIVRVTDMRPGLRSRPLGTIDYALYVPNALVPKPKPAGIKHLLEAVPIGVLNGEPRFSEHLDASLLRAGVRITPAFVCETFPQLRAHVAAGRCAAVLPTLARNELPRARISEHHDAILGKHDGRMNLVWTTRLERQRPRVFALVPGIVRGMQFAASSG